MKRILSLLTAILLIIPASAENNIKLKTVVIDAGHGGYDPGAVSKDRRSYEKNYTLDIARRLETQIKAAYPEVKVILTRNSDEFISLNERAEIANKNEANLFISIHINASTNRNAQGFSVHVLGDSRYKNRDLFAQNMDIVKRENSVILLEEDYSTKYQGFNPEDPSSYIFMTLMQSANREQSLLFAQCVHDKMTDGPFGTDRGIWQDPFYVLWKTSMPAVLVEVAFISNAEDLEMLRNDDIREKVATNIFESFKEYKNIYDSSVNIGAESTPEPSLPIVDLTPVVDSTAQTPAQLIVPVIPAVEETSSAVNVTVPEAVPANVEKTDTVSDKNLFPNLKSSKNAQAADVAAKTESNVKKEVSAQPETVSKQSEPIVEKKSDVLYGTQIFAVKKTIPSTDKMFLGYKPTVIGSSLKKYVIGVSTDKNKASENFKSIKKKYPDSFMVKIENGNLILLR